MENVIVITGRKGSGKDTLVDHFIKNHKTKYKKIQKICFGDQLKKIAHQLFPWCPLNPSHEEKDKPIIHPRNKHNLSPRDIWLILCGFGSSKNMVYIDEYVLLNQTLKEWLPRIAAEKDTLFIFADLRHPWEYDFVTSNKLDIIKIVDITSNEVRNDQENIIDTFDVSDTFYNAKELRSLEKFVTMMELYCGE
ncbi:hypothetical protein Kuja_1450 [Vibrio phage vB_VchM_Kuja]|uniref:Uncharacterized protein n=1 Tax=Vibrio phage vB_VchM_Kuja TaxID=2686437 RepID=A0A6B9JAY6_9CAUD|nr:hypothetical protein HWC83_gp091 [Vibrio phage vB_VchM_Kuja]QGZ16136.1 hypothetical protein Kuja_1450 [Vibrio phage vB_VchM_Kuja]